MKDSLGFHVFSYAIKNAKGQFYLGSVHGDERDWGSRNKAYTYTTEGAHKEIQNFPIFFNGCEVVGD